MGQPATQGKVSRGRFWVAATVAGVLALAFGVVSWVSPFVSGLLICFGTLAKVISATMGAAAKGKDLEGYKADIEERLGYLDAAAALTAFPALFAVGAELILNG